MVIFKILFKLLYINYVLYVPLIFYGQFTQLSTESVDSLLSTVGSKSLAYCGINQIFVVTLESEK